MFEFLKKNKKPENIKDVLSYLEKVDKRIADFSQELEKLKKEAKLHVRKIGAIRYNPFPGVGSDQSFSIALLDDNHDGVVITSLYAREGNRVYAKPIKQGASEYLLSEEEQKAIEKAK